MAETTAVIFLTCIWEATGCYLCHVAYYPYVGSTSKQIANYLVV